MRFFLAVHAGLACIAALVIYFLTGRRAAISFGTGAFIMWANVLIMALVWPRIFAKKLVALSIGVIVFKFAILIWIIYVVVTGDALLIEWFGVGLALVVVSSLVTAAKISKS